MMIKNKAGVALAAGLLVLGMGAVGFAETPKQIWHNSANSTKRVSKRVWSETKTGAERIGSDVKIGTEKAGHGIKKGAHKVAAPFEKKDKDTQTETTAQ